jgi:hypothetical protein
MLRRKLNRLIKMKINKFLRKFKIRMKRILSRLNSIKKLVIIIMSMIIKRITMKMITKNNRLKRIRKFKINNLSLKNIKNLDQRNPRNNSNLI